ncbi:MAG: hypothetical protein OEY10_08615 [Nitrosopumilus sp.]|nr:hypothetical protein [Nitrosopumilus sp.]MDH5727393.1 hypothetical protein [Gammaproteobacteria bacterium]
MATLNFDAGKETSIDDIVRNVIASDSMYEIVSDPNHLSVFYFASMGKDIGYEPWAGVIDVSDLIVTPEGTLEAIAKIIPEWQGPQIWNCPIDIIDSLGDTEHEWALEWRNECRKTHEDNMARYLNKDRIAKAVELRRTEFNMESAEQ